MDTAIKRTLKSEKYQMLKKYGKKNYHRILKNLLNVWLIFQYFVIYNKSVKNCQK